MKLICFFLLAIISCSAHIGENLEQSALRYGPPIKILDVAPDCKCVFYVKADVHIRAEFLKGICVGLEFSREPSFSEAEARTIAVQDGSRWGEAHYFVSQGHPITAWTRSDKIAAMFDSLTGKLSLQAPNWEDWAYLSSKKQKADEDAEAAKSVPNL